MGKIKLKSTSTHFQRAGFHIHWAWIKLERVDYLLISLPSSLKLHALTEPSCPLEKVNGPWVLWKKSSIHGGYVWSHTPLLTGKREGRIKSQTGETWFKLLSLWIQNENYLMNNTFLWHCLLYNTSLTMTLNKILQCDYPRGDSGFQETGMI